MTTAYFDKTHAQQALHQAIHINAKVNVAQVQTENVLWECAKLLDEIATGRYVEEVLAMTFREWVEANFTDDRGQPRRVGWARELAGQCRVVRRYPDLEWALDQGGKAGSPRVTLTSAYFTARLADLCEWTASVRATVQHAYGPCNEPEDYAKREQLFKAALREKLLKCAERPSKVIRNDIAIARAEKGDEAADPAALWPFLGGKVMPEVKETFEEVTDKIVQWVGDPGNTATISFIGRIERATSFLEDVLQAFDAVDEGNGQPLKDLIQKYLDAKNNEPTDGND